MTRKKTPPHIKLDERNHVENPLYSHLNRPEPAVQGSEVRHSQEEGLPPLHPPLLQHG